MIESFLPSWSMVPLLLYRKVLLILLLLHQNGFAELGHHSSSATMANFTSRYAPDRRLKDVFPKLLAKERNRRSVNFRQKEKQILDSVLGVGIYDRRIRPGGVNSTDGKSSTLVMVNIYLRSINDIDDYKMEFSVQITFREQWNDERLKFDDLGGRFRYLTLTDPKKVWMPDTFFRNEKTGHFHAILVNNVYVRVFPNGDVLFSIRISMTLACPMNLKLYPMDRQTCSMKIASYGYTTDDITYLWKETDPVQIAKGLSLPRFSIEKYSSSYCNVKTNTGEYSCLSVDLVFKRQFSYYLITIYVPGCMLVIVSWVSFWLDPHAVPARVALGVTTLLTMSTQTASINSALPPVAYTKAIDVWQGVCVTFVFSALLEYALVNYALRASRNFRHHQRMRRHGYHYSDDDDGGGGGGGRGGGGCDGYDNDEYYGHEDSNHDQDGNGYMFDPLQGNRYAGPIQRQRRNQSQYGGRGGGGGGEGVGGGGGGGGVFSPHSSSCALHKETNLLLANAGSFSFGSSGGSFFPNSLNHVVNSSSNNPSSSPSTSQSGSAPVGPTGNGTTGNGATVPKTVDETALWGSLSRIVTLPFAKPRQMEKAKRIDVISRFLFPMVFAIFNLAYWINYLIQARAEYDLTQVIKGGG